MEQKIRDFLDRFLTGATLRQLEDIMTRKGEPSDMLKEDKDKMDQMTEDRIEYLKNNPEHARKLQERRDKMFAWYEQEKHKWLNKETGYYELEHFEWPEEFSIENL